MSIKEIDTLTGPLTGKPKSATFRTADVVGIDTLVKVANNVYKDCPKDEARELFAIPDYVNKLVEKNWLGDKTKQGFYKKSKDEKGEKIILELDPGTFEYKPSSKSNMASVTVAKPIDNLKDRLKACTVETIRLQIFYAHSIFMFSNILQIEFLKFLMSFIKLMTLCEQVLDGNLDRLRFGILWV